MSQLEETPMETWPPVDAAVTVVSENFAQWTGPHGQHSAVRQLAQHGVGISPPVGPPGVLAPQAGDDLELHWAGERGLQVLPVRLAERVEGGAPVWWCEPTGSLEVRQRRSYVRAPVVARWPVGVVLTLRGPAAGTVEGFLVDLSEGGLRARVKDWPEGQDVPVTVRLVLADGAEEGMDGGRAAAVVAAEELRGTALLVMEGNSRFIPTSTADVHVQFDGSVGCADELRALVFAWQRAARRAAQD